MYFLYLTVCGLSCGPGHVPDPNCSICVFINICEAETPCENNGVCILGSQPDEYTCNCTNTGYTGMNCTGMWWIDHVIVCKFILLGETYKCYIFFWFWSSINYKVHAMITKTVL